MLKITNISPEYQIDQEGTSFVKCYLVDFKITKKNKGETLRLSGQITYSNEILDLSAISGKILFELKNILEL